MTLLHQLADRGSSMWLSALILLAHAPSLHAALLNVTFWNKLSDTEFNVLWHGDPGDGPRQVFGPIPAGGSKIMEVSIGHSFSFAAAGILAPVSEFVIDGSLQEYSITREIVETQRERSVQPEPEQCEHAAYAACRQATSCLQCVRLDGCGWSLVRQACFPAHPIATIDSCEEPQGTAQELLAIANGDLAKRYHFLECALDVAAPDLAPAIRAELQDLGPKLEAVFDDVDSSQLLNQSRHPALQAVHPHIPMVPRRNLSEARLLIARGEPVVITDVFSDRAMAEKTPVHRWTLKYLEENMHDGFYNVAANVNTSCCEYYEPRKMAVEADYPYPFRPTTHLYRDTFRGFASTLRAESKPLLHYLHDVAVERDGAPVMAGKAAPAAIAADLNETTATLLRIARMQAFFGGIANAKLWIGQQGVAMPLHYDSADNLYVMLWGRKRALLAEPGQMDVFYRYPNKHPKVGSSQVNLSNPNLAEHPRFARAKLWETVVGPGDVLFLPANWWHQFEQPFEGTASLNFWSYDSPGAPPAPMRDIRMRIAALYDFMEQKVVEKFGNKAGVLLAALGCDGCELAKFAKKPKFERKVAKAQELLLEAVQTWQSWAASLPGPADAMVQAEPQDVVNMFLDGYKSLFVHLNGWKPGKEWDMSTLTSLGPELVARCTQAPATATYASICRT